MYCWSKWCSDGVFGAMRCSYKPGCGAAGARGPACNAGGPAARQWGSRPDGTCRQRTGGHGDGAIQAERPASSVARWTPPRPASCAAWVRHEKPSARYTASGWADRDGSSECEATATDRS